ncbi:carbohydrate ABC transporter permease [Brachybacterium sp. AOP43-C2-M15]|uniref:carbohydrate ABC transporter permease n=1 Tax=Brachybacterium sp. AOP43-C2-M15 TaxID=3457661 RepID=UPI0040336C5D
MRTERRGGALRALRRHPLVFASLTVYALFNIFCLLWLISTSLKGSAEILATSPWTLPETPLWQNYVDAWTYGRMGTYLMNSVIVTSITTAAVLALGSLSGYIFARVQFPGRAALIAVFMAAMMIPPFALVVPLFDVLAWASLLDSRTGLVLVYVAMELPLVTFILTSFHQTLPKELEEAASIDGASAFGTFWRVVLPQTGPALTACGIVVVLRIWNEFIFALTFIRDEQVLTLAVGIFNLSQVADYSSNWAVLFAGMVISVMPVLIVFGLFQRNFTSGMAQGAMKL